MAIVEVKVPQLSESVAEATLLQWKKKVGDTVAADEILIPLQCEWFGLEGLAKIVHVIDQIKGSGANEEIRLEGIVMTMFDGRTILSRQVVDEVQGDGSGRVGHGGQGDGVGAGGPGILAYAIGYSAQRLAAPTGCGGPACAA